MGIINAPIRTADYDEFADVFRPDSLIEYLATQEWACLAKKPFGQLWALKPKPTSTIGSVIVPALTAEDFTVRMRETVHTLSAISDMTVSQLAEAVASIRADIMFVRFDQTMTDGTIPLKQATQALENIEQMIRAAALTAVNPYSSGRGRAPEAVRAFMDEEVRMGHTKRGSFIITVAARHDLKPLDDRLTSTHEKGAEVVETMSRQVMQTLSRSLSAAKKIVQDTGSMDIAQAVNQGVRAPLIDALSGLSEAAGLKSLDLSFDWSEKLPAPDVEDLPITFESSEFERLHEMSRQFSPPPKSEDHTLVGHVVELRRSEIPDPNDDRGVVVIRADVEGKLRKVQLSLEPDLYETALAAHRQRLPVVASGTLEKSGRSWVLNKIQGISKLSVEGSSAK